jgi:hypothetical protein
MAQRKILSERYLKFLGKRGKSAVSGRRGNIELHHESIFNGFTGGRKKYNDYQGIPLLKEEHTERHDKGLAWWDNLGLSRFDVVLSLLEEYLEELSPFSFETEVKFQEEVDLVEELIEELKEKGEK